MIQYYCNEIDKILSTSLRSNLTKEEFYYKAVLSYNVNLKLNKFEPNIKYIGIHVDKLDKIYYLSEEKDALFVVVFNPILNNYTIEFSNEVLRGDIHEMYKYSKLPVDENIFKFYKPIQSTFNTNVNNYDNKLIFTSESHFLNTKIPFGDKHDTPFCLNYNINEYLGFVDKSNEIDSLNNNFNLAFPLMKDVWIERRKQVYSQLGLPEMRKHYDGM